MKNSKIKEDQTWNTTLDEMKEYAGVMIYLYHCAIRGVYDPEYMRKCLCKMANALDEVQHGLLIKNLINDHERGLFAGGESCEECDAESCEECVEIESEHI